MNLAEKETETDLAAKRTPQRCARRELQIDETPFTTSENRKIIRSSQGMGWSEIAGIYTSETPFENRFRSASTLWLAMPLGDLALCASVGNVTRRFALPRGVVTVYAPHTSVDVKLLTEAEVFHAFIKAEVITEVAADLYGRELTHIDIGSAVGAPNASLSKLLSAFHHMLADPACASFRNTYVARAIVAQVLARHAKVAGVASLPEHQTPLAPRELQIVIEFFHAHLGGDFLFGDLAASIGMSRTSFFQRFAHTTQQTPNQYLQSLRIERAKQLLKNGHGSLVDVALASGFCDQSHMTRFFTRLVGISPARYRKMS